jgi:hypothetical protein
MNIGIEQNDKLIYEGEGMYGRPIWPSPIVLQVVITNNSISDFEPAKFRDLAPSSFLFREDSYDSVSRVRKGRLYKAGNSQPIQWHLRPHPAIPDEERLARNAGGHLKKQLYAFNSFRLKPFLAKLNNLEPIFLLGSEQGFSIWTLINIETSAIGDEHIILRARKSIGALPQLNIEKISSDGGNSALEFLEKLGDEIYRASPDSVVDRAREAATAILSSYLQHLNVVKPGKDLSHLAKKAEENGKYIVSWSANIIARFHGRTKNAEQEKRNTRLLTEHDAEYAVLAVGTILCEIDWASWSYQ